MPFIFPCKINKDFLLWPKTVLKAHLRKRKKKNHDVLKVFEIIQNSKTLNIP